MSDPFHDQLRRQLTDAAAHARLRPGSLVAVTRAGRHRQFRRRRAGVAATAVAAVGVGGIAVVQLTRPAGPRITTQDQVPAPDAPGPAPELTLTAVEPALEWRRIDPDSVAAVGASASGMYDAQLPVLPGVMVSTSPAVAGDGDNYERRLWQSDDGVTWTEVGSLPSDATAAASWAGGGRLYAVGTGPAQAGGTTPVRVSVSDDSGETWTGMAVPADDDSLALVPGVTAVRTQIGGMAGTGDVVFMRTSQTAEVPDLQRLLSEVGLADVATQATGAGIFVVPKCAEPSPTTTQDLEGTTVVASTVVIPLDVSVPGDGCELTEPAFVPWEDFGEHAATIRAALFGERHLFASTAGGPFVEVPLPDGGLGVDYRMFPVGDAVFLTSVERYDQPDSRMWRTTDGVEWTEMTPTPELGPIGQLGDGRLVTTGHSYSGGPTVALSADGRTWQQGDLGRLFGSDVEIVGVTPASVSHLGIASAVQVSRQVGPDQAPPDTAVVRSATTMGGPGQEFLGYEILHSLDGFSWSRESVAQLAGVSDDDISMVSRVQTAGNTIVVAVNLKVAQGEIPAQIVLVGTPKG